MPTRPLTETPARPAAEIPPLGHEEAYRMGLAQAERFIALLESLEESDWSGPTACALWDVREMAAHVAGAAEGYLSFKNFARQFFSKELKKYAPQGLKGIDATNQLQVDDRAEKTPAEIIAELKSSEPQAFLNRYKLPWLLYKMPSYLPGLGFVRVGYLTDLIYTRDTWMHTLDICRAVGREMALTPEHDGRMTALVMRDLYRGKGSHLKGKNIVYRLTGAAGGSWSVDRQPADPVVLEMEALDFHLLASGRLSVQEALARQLAQIHGDHTVGQTALEITRVSY
jgi:uncharacterized protein (TIGR03083 family)